MTQIEEIITEYASRTKQLDSILQELTKEFCADKCFYRPYGCCGNNYSAGIPEEMLLLQEKEAKENGWNGKGKTSTKSTNNHCKYHTKKEGCRLKLYKPPICIGFLCADLRQNINKKYGTEGEYFNELMYKFRHSRLDIGSHEAEKLFSYIDASIEVGKKLLS